MERFGAAPSLSSASAAIQPDISTIARVGAYEELQALLFDPTTDPSADDFLDGRLLYQEAEGLDSRLVRRYDPHFAVPDGTDCTIDEQCVKGFTCVDGACKSGASCLPDGTSKGNDGKITPCAPYTCGGDGLCLNACASSADCVTGAICDVASKVCVPPSSGDSGDSGGCGVAAPGHAASAAWIVAALALLGTRRRRR